MYKLLIADDEAIEREAIQFFIKQADLHFAAIQEAANGIEAVDKALQLMPDILIMDIKMPGKDGLAAAQEIQQFKPDCKIIFLTAFHEFDFAHKAIKLKAEDFIIKPAYSEDFLEVLNKVIVDLDKKQSEKSVIEPQDNKILRETDNDGRASNPSALLVDKVCSYIDENYNKNIKLDEMCEMAGFSKYYFSRIFKQYKNMNLVDYLTKKRLEKAKELLKNPKMSVKEVSAMIGFNDANYLTAVFKKWENISPTEYKNKYCR